MKFSHNKMKFNDRELNLANVETNGQPQARKRDKILNLV